MSDPPPTPLSQLTPRLPFRVGVFAQCPLFVLFPPRHVLTLMRKMLLCVLNCVTWTLPGSYAFFGCCHASGPHHPFFPPPPPSRWDAFSCRVCTPPHPPPPPPPPDPPPPPLHSPRHKQKRLPPPSQLPGGHFPCFCATCAQVVLVSTFQNPGAAPNSFFCPVVRMNTLFVLFSFFPVRETSIAHFVLFLVVKGLSPRHPFF